MKTWKRRWFILTDNCLYYFEYTTVSTERKPQRRSNLLLAPEGRDSFYNLTSARRRCGRRFLPFKLPFNILVCCLSASVVSTWLEIFIRACLSLLASALSCLYPDIILRDAIIMPVLRPGCSALALLLRSSEDEGRGTPGTSNRICSSVLSCLFHVVVLMSSL